MNINPDRERELLTHLDEAVDRMIVKRERHQRLICSAIQAGHDACQPVRCFKCRDAIEEHEIRQCEGCQEPFCEDCVSAKSSWLPDFCDECVAEGQAMQDTYDTMPEGRD